MEEKLSLCYNIPGESIYGEITRGSIAKLVESLTPVKDMYIMDIGSGSGATLCTFGSVVSRKFQGLLKSILLIGYEISEQRFSLSQQIVPTLLPKLLKDIPTTPSVSYNILHKDIMQISHLKATHCFSFDRTFPPQLRDHIMKLQFECPTLINVISNHKYPELYWTRVAAINCRLKGSGSNMMFYVYARKPTES